MSHESLRLVNHLCLRQGHLHIHIHAHIVAHPDVIIHHLITHLDIIKLQKGHQPHHLHPLQEQIIEAVNMRGVKREEFLPISMFQDCLCLPPLPLSLFIYFRTLLQLHETLAHLEGVQVEDKKDAQAQRHPNNSPYGN